MYNKVLILHPTLCKSGCMAVITISRQLGSLGTTLGRLIASRLDYHLVQRDLINRAARLVSSPDMALATIDELGLLGIEPDETQQQAYLEAVESIVGELAEKGNVVIVGRAGQAILQNHPQVLHLRVMAPLETRIQRIVEAHKISPQAAAAQVQDSDRYRADYLKIFYHIDWEDPTLYHLIINTGRIDLKTSAEVVCASVDKISSLPRSQEFPQ
jgi:cytidylate kinase